MASCRQYVGWMDRVRLALPVFDSHDRWLGTVVDLKPCCFSMMPKSSEQKVMVTEAAVADVNDGEVRLKCDSDELSRFGCAAHASA